MESASSSLVADEACCRVLVRSAQSGAAGPTGRGGSRRGAHLEELLDCIPVGLVQVLQIQLHARLHEQLLGDRLEEDHAILFSSDLVQNLHVLVVPVAQPDEDVGDELEVRLAWAGCRNVTRVMVVRAPGPSWHPPATTCALPLSDAHSRTHIQALPRYQHRALMLGMHPAGWWQAHGIDREAKTIQASVSGKKECLGRYWVAVHIVQDVTSKDNAATRRVCASCRLTAPDVAARLPHSGGAVGRCQTVGDFVVALLLLMWFYVLLAPPWGRGGTVYCCGPAVRRSTCLLKPAECMMPTLHLQSRTEK
eukprot:scaffold18317_cov129-Isochrysis_galbana.AAC.5